MEWYSLWGSREYQRQKSSSNDLNVIYFLFLGVNPSRNYSQIYSVFIIVWCTFGLSWIALLFTLFSKLLEITKTKLPCNVLCQTNRTSPVASILYLWPSLEEQSKRESQTSFVNSETRWSNREECVFVINLLHGSTSTVKFYNSYFLVNYNKIQNFNCLAEAFIFKNFHCVIFDILKIMYAIT